MEEKPTAGMKEWYIYTCRYLEWQTEKRSWTSGKFSEANMNKWMIKFRHAFYLVNRHKSTESQTKWQDLEQTKKKKFVVRGRSNSNYPDGAMIIDERLVKVLRVQVGERSSGSNGAILTCRKCVPHFGSIVCLFTGTKTTGEGIGHSDHSGRAKAVRNLSDFENIPKLLEWQ